MNDSTQKHTPGELYREYQNSRDNIPARVYNELVSKAEQAQHDDNIHSILQLAKVSAGVQEAITYQELVAATQVNEANASLEKPSLWCFCQSQNLIRSTLYWRCVETSAHLPTDLT